MGSSPSFLSRQKSHAGYLGWIIYSNSISVSFHGGQIYKEITVQSLKMLGRVSKWRDDQIKIKIKQVGFHSWKWMLPRFSWSSRKNWASFQVLDLNVSFREVFFLVQIHPTLDFPNRKHTPRKNLTAGCTWKYPRMEKEKHLSTNHQILGVPAVNFSGVCSVWCFESSPTGGKNLNCGSSCSARPEDDFCGFSWWDFCGFRKKVTLNLGKSFKHSLKLTYIAPAKNSSWTTIIFLG